MEDNIDKIDNSNEINNENKCKRNKISFLLISFYSGVIEISDLGLKYYLKDQQQMSATIFAKIFLLIKFAYLIKPLYGIFIDFVPIFGYKKKLYLFICFFINILSWYIFIFKNNNNLLISIICHLLINISISFATVIRSAIQVEISRFQDKQKNRISKGTSSLNSLNFIIKTIGSLIPSYFKGFLIEKYSYDVIFYICGLFSFFILISAIILEEDKNVKLKPTKSQSKLFSPLIGQKKQENGNNKIINLINNKNIVILLLLILILESSPSYVSPLFYYEINFLGLNPKNLGFIDFTSNIAIILFIYVYEYFFKEYNFKSLIFFIRILIFGNISLVYLLISKRTQEYINDFILLTFTSSLHCGLHRLAQLPYNLLRIKFSPLGLDATTSAFSDCASNLGNILADYIDYILAIYFNVTHYEFINFGKLIFVENILNLLPLIYIWIIPRRFFSTKKNIPPSSKEMTSLDKETMNNNKNEINLEDNKKHVDSIYKDFVENDLDNNIIGNEVNLNLPDSQNSYRYLNF